MKKVLSLLPLLLMGTIHGGVRKEYINVRNSMELRGQTEKRAHAAALEEIYKTEKGHLYKITHKAWSDCLDFSNNDDGSYFSKENRCIAFGQLTKNALKELKETVEYNDYRDAMLEEEYYINMQHGIEKILYNEPAYSLDKGWTKEEREKNLNAIIDTVNPGIWGQASETGLKQAEDFQTERIQNGLRAIVKKIEAKNHPKQK